MDLSQPLNYNVLVEREGFAFFADIEYENISVFCSHCKKTGHEVKESNSKPKAILETVGELTQEVADSSKDQDAGNGDDIENTVSNNSPQVDFVGPILERVEALVLVPIPPNADNFISQAPVDSDELDLTCVEATQVMNLIQTEGDNAKFLNKAWVNLETAGNDNDNEGPFTTMVIKLSKKNVIKKKKHTTSYQNYRHVKSRSYLNVLQCSFNLPWFFFGDFNAIIGAHEHRGRLCPTQVPMKDFNLWTNSNDLIHIPTIGARYTWSNKRDFPFRVERRLDRCVGNQIWIDSCSQISVSTLSKLLKKDLRSWNNNVFGNVSAAASHAEAALSKLQQRISEVTIIDENLMKQEVKAQSDLLAALNVEEFFGKRSLKLDGMWRVTDYSLVEETIPSLVDESMNNTLTNLPSMEEVVVVVFSINKDSAPGPDGFGAIFYQSYWDIIKEDVANVVLEFFQSGWILPGFNSNALVLIPKVKGDDCLDLFRPITISNFKFKLISKILADRISPIMPYLISKEQRGFIQGRHIHDCIDVASEAFNMLDSKSWCGNIAIKVGIRKAFDTLIWNFLMAVLQKFRFNQKFCLWIKSILHYAFISININVVLQGFFSCNNGVRQGDPLSPLLFCLAEEVLSRKILQLVDNNLLGNIVGPKKVMVPSYIMYADDVLIFCKVSISNIKTLFSTFKAYEDIYGQMVNCKKSSIYGGAMAHSRLNILASLTIFVIGSSPMMYLGLPIFKGKPKKVFLQPIVDKVLSKLASWK
ncbi:uncharacterized protein LOC131614046 [Vicia villosa]|uniref:uncharacterized protein LOC131614046 n=1 Tax=Vicia villosa TaxID=3911 RepID=UPI00273BEDE0|nr:uncharacterized protein LOC131614046 [Vicia villosa]